MSDPIQGYLDLHALGRVRERLKLSGSVPIPSGHKLRSELCLTTQGLWLVAARSSEQGLSLDLLKHPQLRFVPQRLGARLEVGTLKLGVPVGSAESAALMFARARLEARAAEYPHEFHALHAVTPGSVENLGLRALLGDDEHLIALLPGEDPAPVPSPFLFDARGVPFWMVTNKRHALVIFSSLGDIRVVPFDPQSATGSTEAGRWVMRNSKLEWRSRRKHTAEAREVYQLSLLDAPRAQLEFARQNFLARQAVPARVDLCRALLRAQASESASAGLCLWMLNQELGGSTEPTQLATATRHLRNGGPVDALVGELWQAWGFSKATGEALLGALRGVKAEPWALGLHVALHAEESKQRTDLAVATDRDIALAEHALEVGRAHTAEALLNERLGRLPSEALEDLLPASDVDLTAGAGGQVLRIRVRELLWRAQSQAGESRARSQNQAAPRETPDLSSLLELARLQPLVLDRIQALAKAATGELLTRTLRVVRLLEPGGLACSSNEAPPAARSRLPEQAVTHELCHPLARDESPLLGKLQALIAAAPAPDHAVLRDYCEQLSETRYPTAARALGRASFVLGMPEAQAFISRGNKSVGLRSYENQPGFVLIGGQHLEEPSRFFMTERELCFAVGAELAHLRFGHARVTSSEVWAGALSKTREGLELALTILPALKGLRLADGASRVLSKLPDSTLDRILRRADQLSRLAGRRLLDLEQLRANAGPNADVLSAINEELVAAHRLMQLTADRAGLLVSGDIAAAARAMMLVRADYREALAAAETQGLAAVLSQRDESGSMVHQDLAVRIAALLSFFLSAEYQALRQAVERPHSS